MHRSHRFAPAFGAVTICVARATIAVCTAVALAATLALPARALAQKTPPETMAQRVRKDSLASAERGELRRLARTTRETARAQQKADTSATRAAARAAEPTAFADSGARELLARARLAREQQDSAFLSRRCNPAHFSGARRAKDRIGKIVVAW
jgi:hypothetical protein